MSVPKFQRCSVRNGRSAIANTVVNMGRRFKEITYFDSTDLFSSCQYVRHEVIDRGGREIGEELHILQVSLCTLGEMRRTLGTTSHNYDSLSRVTAQAKLHIYSEIIAFGSQYWPKIFVK